LKCRFSWKIFRNYWAGLPKSVPRVLASTLNSQVAGLVP
jgi:hypothetical protein